MPSLAQRFLATIRLLAVGRQERESHPRMEPRLDVALEVSVERCMGMRDVTGSSRPEAKGLRGLRSAAFVVYKAGYADPPMTSREESWTWIAMLAVLLVPSQGSGQSLERVLAASSTRPQAVAVRTADRPTIDGRTEDAAWASAVPSRSFTQKFPDEGQAPREQTEIRVLFDDSALYVAFDCTQTSAPVRGRLARRDRQVESDWVQIAVNDGANTYEFSVNAAGVLSDGVRFNDTDYSADWDGVWDAQVAKHDQGWSAEMQIPLRIFRHSGSTEAWGFQARRYTSHWQETDEWAFIPRSTAGEVSHYGKLSGITSLRRSNPLELLPYALVGANWQDMTPASAERRGLGYLATAGIDLAWRAGKDLTLDASVNPDFAQVEADQLVFNLTTFETFVPEKRPFFLKGMEIFQVPRMELVPSPQTLFYTRRIGSVPDVPVIGSGSVDMAASPEPSPIYAAAKLSGQLGQRVTAALLSAVTGRNDVTLAPAGEPPQPFLAAPLAFAGVGRFKVAVGKGGNLGVLATALRRFEPSSGYPIRALPGGGQVQDCPDGSMTRTGTRCFHDSYAVGLDGGWRSASGTYAMAGQAIVTSIQHGPPRMIPDGTVIEAGDTSPAGRLYLAKEGGQWIGSVEAEAVGRRVDYNDLGFLLRQNQWRTLSYLGYRTFEPFWHIAETETHFYVPTRDSLDGVTLLRGYDVGGTIRFKNFWSVAADFYQFTSRFEDREVGDGTALQRPSAVGLDASVSTDPRRQIAAAIATSSLFYRTGTNVTINAELTYHPLPQLELQVLPEVILSSGDPRFVSGSRADGGYLFGHQQARAVGSTLRTSYAFTNRLTLQLYGQLLLVAERYSNFQSFQVDPAADRPVIRLDELTPAPPPATRPDGASANLNLNAVLRWEFRPGSTLFLVYSRFQSPTLAPDDPARLDLGALRDGPADDAVRLKLSYYWN